MLLRNSLLSKWFLKVSQCSVEGRLGHFTTSYDSLLWRFLNVFFHKLPSYPHQLAFYLNLPFFMAFYLFLFDIFSNILSAILYVACVRVHACPAPVEKKGGRAVPVPSWRRRWDSLHLCVKISRPETVAGAEKKTKKRQEEWLVVGRMTGSF